MPLRLLLLGRLLLFGLVPWLPFEAAANILTLDRRLEWSPPALPDLSARRAEARALPVPEPGTFEIALVAANTLPRLRNHYLDAAAQGPVYGGDRKRIPAIHLLRGTADLPAIAARMPEDRRLLTCTETACELRAPLFVEAGATLVITDRRVTLEAPRGAMLVSAGRIFLERAELVGSENGRPAMFREAGRFRPFLLVLSGGEGIIRNSRLSHLGFAAGKAYGLVFATDQRRAPGAPPPTGVVKGSEIVQLYYGFYTSAAHNLLLLDNVFRDSIRYGIDPHDGSRNLLIAGNRVEGTRERHGIVLSRRVTDSVVTGNRVSGNGGSGIMLDRRSDRNLVADNIVTGNGADGISVYESNSVWLLRNILRDNARTGIRVRNSRGVVLAENRIIANRDAGIRLYTGPSPGIAAELGAGFIQRLSGLLQDNVLSDNDAADIIVKGGGIEWLALAHEGAGEADLVVKGDKSWRRALTAAAGDPEAVLFDSRLVPTPELIRLPLP